MKYMLLNLPNPPGRNIYREFAGGFGTLGTISSEVLLPTYLLYGASAIERSGCDYEILDAQAEKYTPAQIVDAVVKSKPDVLITWVSLPSLYDDLRMLDNIKQAAPNLLIAVLGAVSNAMPEEILKRESVDLVVRGNYPHYNLILNLVKTFSENPLNKKTFYMIGGAVYRSGDRIVRAESEPCGEDLNHLSLDLYYKIPVEKYIGEFEMRDGSTMKCIPIVTAVGCPHSCIYCPYPVGYGNSVQIKSVENMIAEIMFLKEKFGIKGFLFRDQNFTRSRKRVISFCDEVIDRGLGIRWLIESRVDKVTEELLSRMQKAGCFRIHYGVETGEPELLEKTGKPGVRVEDVKRAFAMTKDAGIFTVAFLIIGLPGESKETLGYTSRFLQEINPDNVGLNVLTPYPGTKLYETALEQGRLMSDDWSEYTSSNAVIVAGDLDVEQLNRIKNDIRKKFINWKVMHDPVYRGFFIRSLPRKIRDRCMLLIHRTSKSIKK